jgi:cell division protein FtsQ
VLLDDRERRMPRMKSLPAPDRSTAGASRTGARRRRRPEDRPSRGSLLLRRARRLLRPGAWAVVGFGVLLLVSMMARSAGSADLGGRIRDSLAAVMGLRVAHVVIEGRANTPEPLVRAAIGVMPGDSLLGFSVSAARQRIETLSWVENAAVERRLPDTVLVRLTERRPFAVWQNQKKFSLIDRNGQVVGDQDVAQFGSLPLVVGADAPAFAAGLLDALAAQPSLQSHVAALVRVGDRRWNLRLLNGADVMLPEGNEISALARLAQLQASDALLDRPLAVVDMRLPDRLVIRARTDPAPAPAARKPT